MFGMELPLDTLLYRLRHYFAGSFYRSSVVLAFILIEKWHLNFVENSSDEECMDLYN